MHQILGSEDSTACSMQKRIGQEGRMKGTLIVLSCSTGAFVSRSEPSARSLASQEWAHRLDQLLFLFASARLAGLAGQRQKGADLNGAVGKTALSSRSPPMAWTKLRRVPNSMSVRLAILEISACLTLRF